MEKLVVCIMGQNCEKFIGMCIESVIEADDIIYCDGGSTDETIEIVKTYHIPHQVHVIENKYNQEDKGMNGKQRNFYLKYLKENYPDYWCLALDADEVVEDLNKVKEFIQTINYGVYSLKMRHLIGDLSHEDSTLPIHWVQNRLFKISKANKYPEIEHPVLEPIEDSDIGGTDCTIIWHLSNIPNLFSYKQKYENHMKKSTIHSPQYLKQWYYFHIFGQYPRKEFNPIELPRVILKEFGIDKDELYFMNRGLEVKHFLMMKNWLELVNDDVINILDIGCGLGHYGYAFHLLHKDGGYSGWEKSKWAVENSYKELNINQVDITKNKFSTSDYDLVLLIDILEHLKYEDLDKVINNFKSAGEKIIVSVPFKGTPNCDNDPTHIIKEDRDWWIKKFTDVGLKLISTPEHFLYKSQILIFENELEM